MGDSLCKWFDDPEFGDVDDLFSILENLEEVSSSAPPPTMTNAQLLVHDVDAPVLAAIPSPSPPVSTVGGGGGGGGADEECAPKGAKRQKVVEEGEGNGGVKTMSHITVERNRRKQMNEHLGVLRALMPCFYVKRGDQASIIGGVVDYISELQQILQSLEAKKQRKVYSEVLSPRLNNVPSPRPSPAGVLSPRKSPLSPRLNLPMCPRTPQPGSPYSRPWIQPPLSPPPAAAYLSPTLAKNQLDLSPCSSSTSSIHDTSNELVANSKSPFAEVEVKFSGPNLVLKTRSQKIAGQVVKIVSTLEDLSLEILKLDINTLEDMALNSFTIKIGIECQLSAEELALQIQQTFC